MRTPTLRQFFRHQLNHGFARHGLAEPTAVEYVSEVLTRFAETRALYAVADRDGRPLEYIVDFLCALTEPDSRDRARHRSLRRHLGEYTLFMSGLFRERLRARGELGYYMNQGAAAYRECASTELHPGRRQLFHRLHGEFPRFADALNALRRPATADNPLAAFWGS